MATRDTQITAEVVEQSTVLRARVTQVTAEVVEQSTVLKARVTQVAVEVLYLRVVGPQPMTAGIIG
jgi:hypothetical protein